MKKERERKKRWKSKKEKRALLAWITFNLVEGKKGRKEEKKRNEERTKLRKHKNKHTRKHQEAANVGVLLCE